MTETSIASNIRDFHHPTFGLIAYRLHDQKCYPVSLLKDPSGQKVVAAQDFLISTGVTLSLGNGIFLPVAAPGLYRIQTMDGSVSRQWFCGDTDLISLSSDLAALFYHSAEEPAEWSGSDWNSLQRSVDYLLETAPKGKVACTCMTASFCAGTIATAYGFQAVLWQFENLFTDFLPAQSHVMIELTKGAGEPRLLLDVDRKCLYTDPEGNQLDGVTFIERARAGQEIRAQRISPTRIAGFGAAKRDPRLHDFTNELLDLAGEAYLADIATILGQSELIKGMRLHENGATFTLASIATAAEDLLAESPEGHLDPTQRKLLNYLTGLERAEF